MNEDYRTSLQLYMYCIYLVKVIELQVCRYNYVRYICMCRTSHSCINVITYQIIIVIHPCCTMGYKVSYLHVRLIYSFLPFLGHFKTFQEKAVTKECRL